MIEVKALHGGPNEKCMLRYSIEKWNNANLLVKENFSWPKWRSLVVLLCISGEASNFKAKSGVDKAYRIPRDGRFRIDYVVPMELWVNKNLSETDQLLLEILEECKSLIEKQKSIADNENLIERLRKEFSCRTQRFLAGGAELLNNDVEKDISERTAQKHHFDQIAMKVIERR